MSGESSPWARGSLRVAKSVLAKVEAHALEQYPNECCGFLIGPASDAALLDEAIAETNIANRLHAMDPERFPRTAREYFEFDAMRFARAIEEGEARGRPVKVVYHSHCECGAYFSETDAETFAPWGTLTVPCAFLVVSVIGGEVRDHKLWVHHRDREFVESSLEVIHE